MSEAVNHTLRVSAEQVAAIFGNRDLAEPEVMDGDPFLTQAGVQLQFGDTRLGVRDDPNAPGEYYYIPGNTVPRLCGALGECASAQCGLGNRPMSLWERIDKDCAVANTVEVFGKRPGFIVTQTNNEVVFLADENSYDNVTFLDQKGYKQVAFGKTKPGAVLVVAESDIPEEAVDGIFVGANNADNSFGVATLELLGERYALLFSSTRLNLGDRNYDAQILRKSIEGIADRKGLEGEERRQAIAELQIQIDIGYSADLENFAFDIHIPTYDPPEELKGIDMRELTEEQLKNKKLSAASKNARHLLIANNHLNEDGSIKEGEAGRITPSEFMNFWYPGALRNGEVVGHPEVELGLNTPRTEEGCPGDGELCHIDYPRITERTLRTQLVEMGIPEENITYDLSRMIDTGSTDNRLASNRAMDLAGVKLNKTLRSINGVAIKFPPR